jgi:hypothetical protein
VEGGAVVPPNKTRPTRSKDRGIYVCRARC